MRSGARSCGSRSFCIGRTTAERSHIDNIRLSSEKLPPQEKTQFTLAGSDLVLSGNSSANAVIELGKKLKERRTPPERKPLNRSIRTPVRARYAELKQCIPESRAGGLRDGEKGL